MSTAALHFVRHSSLPVVCPLTNSAHHKSPIKIKNLSNTIPSHIERLLNLPSKMDLLFSSEETDYQVDRRDAAQNNEESMANLLRLLTDAERIVNDTEFDGQEEEGDFNCFFSTIHECNDIYEDHNIKFTPSIFDTSMTISSCAAPRNTNTIIVDTSNAVQSTDSSNDMDPFEPTPIGPHIHIVRDVPMTSLLLSRHWTTGHPNSYRWSEDTSMDPRPMAASSSSSLDGSHRSGSNASKFQAGQWKQRFRELLEFQRKHGHMLVPHYHPENTKLSQWVKRYVLCNCVIFFLR